MTKLTLGLILAAFLPLVAFAETTIGASYKQSFDSKAEVAQVELQHTIKRLQVGANVEFNDDDVTSYGLTAGVPYKVGNTYKATLTPYVGVSHIDEVNEVYGVVGVGAKLPIAYGVALQGKVQYEFLEDSDDTAYTVGLTKSF